MDVYNPKYQPWTGGGEHFAFLNQPHAAKRNFHMFCASLLPLLASDENAQSKLEEIEGSFYKIMQKKMENMWASKLGLDIFDAGLFRDLEILMHQTTVDYTLFFRELSQIPDDLSGLKKSFYKDVLEDELEKKWSSWLEKWNSAIRTCNAVKLSAASPEAREELSQQMKRINPKYTLREWFLVPAYQDADDGDYGLIKELQEVMTNPYEEQSKEIEEKYYRLKPSEFFQVAGISHISCSS